MDNRQFRFSLFFVLAAVLLLAGCSRQSRFAAAERAFGDRVEISGGDAGIHILMRVRCGLTADELIERGMTIGVRLYDTKELYIDGKNRPSGELLLGFPTIPDDDMEMIMKRLAEVWEI